MTNLLNYLDRQSKLFNIILSCILVAALGFLDYSTAHDASFGVIYLLPVALAAWFLSGRAGIVTSFVAAIIGLTADVASGQIYVDPLTSYRNVLVRFVFLIVVASLLSALRRAYQYQKALARTDYLTDVANARSFYESAQTEISRARRYEHPFTLAYLDVDNFKAVNDKHGHEVGDQLLKTVGEVVKENLRATDIVARIGGDEFAILLPETGNEAAEFVIQKVQKTLMDEMQKNGWFVTFSIGVVTCLDPPRTVAEVVKWSDNLVYAAKSSGKNTIKYDVIADYDVIAANLAGAEQQQFRAS